MIKRYLKVFDSQLPFFIFWIGYLLSFFSGLIRYYFINHPESNFAIFSTPTNILWHLSLPVSIIFIILFIFWIWRYVQKEKTVSGLVFLSLTGASALVSFSFSLYLLGLEASHYNNYIYSTFGFTKSSVYWLENISLLVLIPIVGILASKKEKVKVIGFGKTAAYFAVGILIWYVTQSVLGLGQSFSYLHLSYQDEFKNYDSMISLKNKTPEGAFVVIPKQGGIWPDISNGPIARYFIYPRIIISSTYLTDQEKVETFHTLYFITLLGSDGSSWPVITKTKNQIFFTIDHPLNYRALEDLGSGVYKINF